MDAETIAALGRQIRIAEETQSPEPPISDRFENIDVTDAYSVQEAYSRLRRDEGAELIGRKIGCTSEAIQNRFSIETPDYGRIFDDMVIEDGGSVPTDELIEPMVEPEIGFILGDNLQGPGVTREEVLDATAGIAPCLEIIDSRIKDWEIRFEDTVADNGSSARSVFGPRETLSDDLDLATERVTFLREGERIAAGAGKDVLGHPAEAVAWLANALAEFDQSLQADEWVLSGSITDAAEVASGLTYEAQFESIGRVSCDFQ